VAVKKFKKAGSNPSTVVLDHGGDGQEERRTCETRRRFMVSEKIIQCMDTKKDARWKLKVMTIFLWAGIALGARTWTMKHFHKARIRLYDG